MFYACPSVIANHVAGAMRGWPCTYAPRVRVWIYLECLRKHAKHRPPLAQLNKSNPHIIDLHVHVHVHVWLYALHSYDISTINYDILSANMEWPQGWACWLGVIFRMTVVHHAFGREQQPQHSLPLFPVTLALPLDYCWVQSSRCTWLLHHLRGLGSVSGLNPNPNPVYQLTPHHFPPKYCSNKTLPSETINILQYTTNC